jgi:hypothetical protein
MNERGSSPLNEARLNPAVFVCKSGNPAHAVKSYIETGKSKNGKWKLENPEKRLSTA